MKFLEGRVDLGARQEETAFDFFRLQKAEPGAGALLDPAARPAAEGGQGGDVLEQPLAGIQAAGGFLGLGLPGLEINQRFRDDAIAEERGAVSPGRVEVAHFAGRQPGG